MEGGSGTGGGSCPLREESAERFTGGGPTAVLLFGRRRVFCLCEPAGKVEGRVWVGWMTVLGCRDRKAGGGWEVAGSLQLIAGAVLRIGGGLSGGGRTGEVVRRRLGVGVHSIDGEEL